MMDNRTGKVHTILVTIPGRYPVCQKCGENSHATMKCRKGKPTVQKKDKDSVTKPKPTVETENGLDDPSIVEEKSLDEETKQKQNEPPLIGKDSTTAKPDPEKSAMEVPSTTNRRT